MQVLIAFLLSAVLLWAQLGFIGPGCSGNAQAPFTQPPDLNAFTVANSASAAVANTAAITINVPGSSTASARILYKANVAAPYTFTANIGFTKVLATSGTEDCGIALYNSSTTKMVTLAYGATSTTTGFTANKYTNPTTISASYGSIAGLAAPAYWLRIKDDGTNRLYSISADGYNFIQVLSVANTDFTTSDSFAFYGDTTFVTRNHFCHLNSWQITQP